MILAFVEIDFILKIEQLAINAGARVSVLGECLHLFLELALAAAHDWRHHHDPVLGSERHDPLYDLVGRLPTDGATAAGAMGRANRGEQQAKIIVNFRDGADRGARTPARGLLLNRDRGAKAINAINVRSLHLVQELPRVGGKRLHIPALALGVDGVERQRRLTRTAEAGNHGQRVTGDFDTDVL